jgi:predicted metal-binding protein
MLKKMGSSLLEQLQNILQASTFLQHLFVLYVECPKTTNRRCNAQPVANYEKKIKDTNRY